MKKLKLKKLNNFFLRCQFLYSERQNLYDDLYLIDPSIISFNEKSLLNALLYGSDEFSNKINREILLCTIYHTKPTINMCSISPRDY